MPVTPKPYTFSAGAVIIASEHNSNFDALFNLVNGTLDTNNLSPSAAIADTQLAQITTASKVSGTAITGLASLPSGAGVIPSANLPSGSPSLVGLFSNLVVTYASAATITITADEIICKTAIAGTSGLASSVNVTANITVSGANGLDTGSENSNTTYYAYVIRKSSDGTKAALLSIASTIAGITFPAGYDQAALVSAVRNDGSSNFISFKQTGRIYCYPSWQTIGSGNTTPASWTSVDVSAFVPSALSNFIFGSVVGNANLVAVTNDSGVAASSTDARNKVGVGAIIVQVYWQFDLITANTIYWLGNNASSALYLHGFELNKIC